jgi:hypothetical protein
MNQINYSANTSSVSVKSNESAIIGGKVSYLSFVGSYSAVKAIIAACRLGYMMTIDGHPVTSNVRKGDGGQGKAWIESLPETGKCHGIWVTSDPHFIMHRGSTLDAFKMICERYCLPHFDDWADTVLERFIKEGFMKPLFVTGDKVKAYIVRSKSEELMGDILGIMLKEKNIQFGGAV